MSVDAPYAFHEVDDDDTTDEIRDSKKLGQFTLEVGGCV